MNTIQSWWGNNVFTNTADWNGVPLRSVVEGDHFGCVLCALLSGLEYAGADVCAAGRTLGRLAVCCNIRCICCCRSQCFYWVIDVHFGGTLKAVCAWTVRVLRMLSKLRSLQGAFSQGSADSNPTSSTPFPVPGVLKMTFLPI